MKKKIVDYPYGFNGNTEYYIYLYACGRKLRKKKLAVIGDKKYCTYEEWEEYINQKYCGITTKSLEAFKRWLRYRIRAFSKVDGGYISVMVPFVIIAFTILFDRFFPEKDIITNICCILGIIWISGYMIANFAFDAKKVLMYEDYLEIVENMLEERKM